MKKIVLWYIAILAVLDLAWASLMGYFGTSLLSAAGHYGELGAPDTNALSHSGGAVVFIIALFQSFAFDFILTIAIFMAIVLWGVFGGKAKKNG